MFGMPSQSEIEAKVTEIQQIIINHEETWHYGGVTVSVIPNQIKHLHFEDGAVITAELVQKTVNTAFTNHQKSALAKVQVFIEQQSPVLQQLLSKMPI